MDNAGILAFTAAKAFSHFFGLKYFCHRFLFIIEIKEMRCNIAVD